MNEARARGADGTFLSTWSADEEALLRERFDEGASDAVLSRELGRPWASVRLRRYALGLKRAHGAVVLAENPGWQGAANGSRLYWTDERVDEALRRYARAHAGPLPRGTKQWDVITRGRADLPVSGRILQQYTALGNAWRALLPAREIRSRLPLQWVRYTEREDEYIREHVSTDSMQAIAAHLGRTLQSVRMHARRELGIALSETREWWSPREVAEHFGCPLSRVYKLIWSGELPSRKAGRQLVDARYLPGVAEPRAREAGQDVTLDEHHARLARIESALRAQNQRRPKPVVLRRHRAPGHDDVITRTPPSQRMAS